MLPILIFELNFALLQSSFSFSLDPLCSSHLALTTVAARPSHLLTTYLVALHQIRCDCLPSYRKEVIETAYASLSDKDNFASVVLAALQWQEDRDDVKKALGL